MSLVNIKEKVLLISIAIYSKYKEFRKYLYIKITIQSYKLRFITLLYINNLL